jgi:hypothetical protein
MDVAAEAFFARIQRADILAFDGRQQFVEDSGAESAKIRADHVPIVSCNPERGGLQALAFIFGKFADGHVITNFLLYGALQGRK